MRILLLAVLASFATGCSHASSRRSVVVEGWAGAGEGGDRRAVADALRRAVEQSGGVRVDARTRVDKGVALDARVVTRAAGCVLEHEVLAHGGAKGGSMARVRVVLSPDGAECAGRTSLPPAAFEDAKVSISFTGDGAYGAEAAESAASGLRAALVAQGLVVVTEEADFRVEGTIVVSRHQDARILPFVGARVEMAVRVIDARSGRVVREARHEAAALDADGGSAARGAAADAARSALLDALIALDEAAWLAPVGMKSH